MPSHLKAVTDPEFLALAERSPHPLPIEQAPRWDAYDRATVGRTRWGRYAVLDDADQALAIIALTEFAGRGFRYLWAKHGPVWLQAEPPTAAQEAALREALLAEVRRRDPGIAFVRLHAEHRAPELHELLQTVTYDRTVILDPRRTEDELFAEMKKGDRYSVRKAVKDETMTVAEETGRGPAAFDELYAVLRETAERDSFGIYPASVYRTMLDTLGDAARVFVARRDGRVLAWAIVTVYDGGATYYYGAGTAEGRKALAAYRVQWEVLRVLRVEGVRHYDLMGVASDRAPQLAGVSDFKTKFAAGTTAVPGAWDVPARPGRYALLVRALRAKRALGGLHAKRALGGLLGRVRSGSR